MEMKQGVWSKKYKNGNIRYKGQFQNDKPQGLFSIIIIIVENYKPTKEFFHNGEAAATHFFYKAW